jgi:hypothetical protein
VWLNGSSLVAGAKMLLGIEPPRRCAADLPVAAVHRRISAKTWLIG